MPLLQYTIEGQIFMFLVVTNNARILPCFNFSVLYQDAFHLMGYMCVHLFEMGTAFSKFSLAPCGFSVFLVGSFLL